VLLDIAFALLVNFGLPSRERPPSVSLERVTIGLDRTVISSTSYTIHSMSVTFSMRQAVPTTTGLYTVASRLVRANTRCTANGSAINA
jgi:hypothetical protein